MSLERFFCIFFLLTSQSLLRRAWFWRQSQKSVIEKQLRSEIAQGPLQE